jgi:hypothetical protein
VDVQQDIVRDGRTYRFVTNVPDYQGLDGGAALRSWQRRRDAGVDILIEDSATDSSGQPLRNATAIYIAVKG